MSALIDFNIPLGQKREQLTSRHWLTVFDMLALRKKAPKGARIQIDLSKIEWMGHLPLLALCLGAQQVMAERFRAAAVRMPVSGSVRAFLHRWKFNEILEKQGFVIEGDPPEQQYQESFTQSCVLPIHPFAQPEQTKELINALQSTGTQIYKLLRTAAFLDDEGIRGLAELIVRELCKNVIEHSVTTVDAFIFGRVSKKDDRVRHVYEENAAEWEKRFLQSVHGEGMTELVLGDSGVGIVKSLADQALTFGKKTPEEILEWAFEPFSTSKRDSEDQTRGLWVVKNKVRDLRGVLYVRTSDGRGGGISAWWDFLNKPLSDRPEIIVDKAPFIGTQYQILLPHMTEERPRTFISCDRAAAAAATRELRPVGFQIPSEPPPRGKSLGLREAITEAGPDEVLFIDMSQMNHAAWERTQLDAVGRTLFETINDEVTTALKTNFRRVCLLNPSDDTLRGLASSNWIISLWKQHGVLQPVVMSEADAAKPPKVRFVIHQPNLRSNEPGDTETSRRELHRLIGEALASERVTRSSISPALTIEERTWLTLHLSMNSACVELRGDADGLITPAFDVESLANAVVEALLPVTLRERVQQAFAEQDKAAQRVWYRLPSNRFCRNYVDPRILTQIETPARNALEKWIERKVADTRARYAISYTSLAPSLLTRAARATPGIRCIALKHYVRAEYEELDKSIERGSRVVIVAGVSGSAVTIERILERLEALECDVTVICLVNTFGSLPAKLPRLKTLDARGRFVCLLRTTVEIYDKLPEEYEHEPISAIDPDTLIPLPPVSFASKLSDGEFWQIVGESQGLSIQATTYRGHDYTTMFLMRNIFKSTPARQSRAVGLVLDHVASCFDGRNAPDIICSNIDTDEALRTTHARAFTEERFPPPVTLVTGESEHDFAANTAKLEGKHVVIFAAAAYSGSAMTRLLKHFETAQRIHICVFLSRLSEAMIASFTRNPKVTFTTFRRIYSGSSESSAGSARVIRLKNLTDYRPSCVSNRLLLFVEEKQREIEEYVAAQNPDQLDGVVTPLRPPNADLFRKGDEYRFDSSKGQEHLLALVKRCRPEDAEWAGAVLEEAVSRADIANRGGLPAAAAPAAERYIDDVCSLYKAATNAEVQVTILDALLLDRWHGRDDLGLGDAAAAFGHTLLGDIRQQTSPAKLRVACIRTLSKIARGLLINNLEEIIDAARSHRPVELTLALELTKILDDDKTADDLRKGLEKIKRDRRKRGAPDDAVDVALDDLLADIGLDCDANGNVDFLPWDRMYEILQSEPPNAARTIRALIRWIRALLGPRGRILYYRRAGDRFVYVDAWKRREATEARTVRQRNVIAAGLIDQNSRHFYSPNVSEDRSGLDLYYNKLNDEEDREELKKNALFVHGVSWESDDTLRIFYDVSDGNTMPAGSLHKLREAVSDAEKLLRRIDSSMTRIGTFQYLDAVQRFQAAPATQGYDPLHEFIEKVFALLGADIGSVVVLDESTDLWGRQRVIGARDVKPDELSPFSNSQSRRVTVKAATTLTHVRIYDFEDLRKQNFDYEPLVPWAPAWLALPMVEHKRCRVVVHLWHHIPGWFHQHPDDLLRSLSALGGGIQQIRSDYENAREAQRQKINRVKLDPLAKRLRNLTVIAGGMAEDGDTNQQKLAQHIYDIQAGVEALVSIVQEEDTEPHSVPRRPQP